MLKHVDDEQRSPQRCIADAGDVESYWDRLLVGTVSCTVSCSTLARARSILIRDLSQSRACA
jgi:hypothetical protein